MGLASWEGRRLAAPLGTDEKGRSKSAPLPSNPVSKSLKNISVVAGATVASRVLGLVREMATATVFGTGALNSAFVSAFTLPNLFRRLLGEGALTAAFVPTLTHELEKSKREGLFEYGVE